MKSYQVLRPRNSGRLKVVDQQAVGLDCSIADLIGATRQAIEQQAEKAGLELMRRLMEDERKLLADGPARRGWRYVLTPHVYKFEEYGVPQTRHRLIIVGIRRDQKLTFRVPAPTTPNPKDWMSSKKALADLNPLLPNNHEEPVSEAVRKRIENTPAGHNCWSSALPKKYRLTGVKGARLSNIYKRLDPNKPAYTVTGSGGTHMYHWKERSLTSRRACAAANFPRRLYLLRRTR